MISPQEAEVLANKIVGEYLTACKLDDQAQAGDALMKLASMCGLAMCATVGQAEMLERMLGTVEYLSRPEFGRRWIKATVN